MKKLFQIVLISCLSLLCFSCYYDTAIENIIPDVDREVFFSADIQPILTKCVGCHNASLSPDLREGNSYNALVPAYVTASDAEASRLYDYLPGNGEHPSVDVSLNTDEIALIQTWINQGAKNN